jgi:hypothetical protein
MFLTENEKAISTYKLFLRFMSRIKIPNKNISKVRTKTVNAWEIHHWLLTPKKRIRK